MRLPILLSVALLGLRLFGGETSVPLGVVCAGQEAFFDLVYHNETSGPVQIQQVKPSCDCITILTFPATVAAKSVVRIPCVYRSAVPGNIRTVVEIFGADSAHAQSSFRVMGFVAEKEWLLSPREVLAGPRDQTFFLDVRSAEEFSRAHAPRAMNLPLFSLKSRIEMRSRRVVLFGDGATPESLLAEVLVLRAHGFEHVAVLNGGIAAWVRAGGAVEGTMKSATRLSSVTAAKFDRSNATNPWLCVAVGTVKRKELELIPMLQAADVSELEKILEKSVWPVSGGLPFRPVLIIVADPRIQARIESRFGGNQAQQLFYLDGGRGALATYHAEQVALARHTDQTFVADSVASRPASRPVVSGRCGSCGR